MRLLLFCIWESRQLLVNLRSTTTIDMKKTPAEFESLSLDEIVSQYIKLTETLEARKPAYLDGEELKLLVNIKKDLMKAKTGDGINLEDLTPTEMLTARDNLKRETGTSAQMKELLGMLIEATRSDELAFLGGCSQEELSTIHYWLTKEVKIEKDGSVTEKIRELEPVFFDSFISSDNLGEKLVYIEESILRMDNEKAAKDRYRSLLKKVCDQFEVNYHPLTETPLLERELLQKVWDLEFEKLTVEDIRQISLEKFRRFKFYTEWITNYSSAIPIVLLIASYRRKFQ